ncbi:hypothetical protein, partial [Vibrio cholerae]|uniref:hypothetical protein n=1 Tax=Vibrio cholerae TaxID=666 RepID=UPI00195627E4
MTRKHFSCSKEFISAPASTVLATPLDADLGVNWIAVIYIPALILQGEIQALQPGVVIDESSYLFL